jgi:ligand-binding sensor domain-containing protein
VEHLGTWKRITDPLIFPAGAIVNNNAITHDRYGYVYIGTSNGLLIFNGGSAVDNPVGWTRLTTDDGLLSNNVTGVAYDYKNGRVLLTTDAGISFMIPKYKIRCKHAVGQ